MEKILELEKKIKYHNNKYWVENNPEISDQEYDKLIEELKNLQPENLLLNEINDYYFTSKGKIKHIEPMLSLDKAYSYEKIIEFVNKISRDENECFSLTPKYDGLSGRLYKSGILSSRGDGHEGENLSDKIYNINFLINNENQKYINGELIFKKDYFLNFIKKNYKRSDGKEYENSRNAVAGLLNSDNIDKDIRIDFVSHNKDSIHIIKKDFSKKRFEEIINIIKTNCLYEMDGIVIKLMDNDYAKILGNTQHHPRSAVAYKFTNISKKSTIKNIIIDVGMTNKVTPKAIIEPIEINGVNITQVTLHNFKFIFDNDIRINDIVEVERSGDVIPHIINVEKSKNRKLFNIGVCPYCNTTLEYIEPEMYCTNNNCYRAIIKRLYYGISQLKIQDIGLSTIEKIYNKFKFNNLYQILEMKIDDFIKLEGFADKSSENLYGEIQRLKTEPIEDYVLISSLYIPNVGSSVSKKILEKYTIEELLNLSKNKLSEDIHGIGEKIESIFINSIKENIETIEYFLNNFNIINTKNIIKENKKTICFSGKFEQPKKYYYDIAISKGYEIKTSVNKELNILVSNETDTTKIKKAKSVGIEIINIEEFLKL